MRARRVACSSALMTPSLSRSEEHTPELQSRQYLPSSPPRRYPDQKVTEPLHLVVRGAGPARADLSERGFSRAARGLPTRSCRRGRTRRSLQLVENARPPRGVLVGADDAVTQ